MKPKVRMVEPVLATLVALIGTAFILSDPLGPHAHSLGPLPTVGSEFVSFLWNYDFVPVLEKTLIVASLCGTCWSWYRYANRNETANRNYSESRLPAPIDHQAWPPPPLQ